MAKKRAKVSEQADIIRPQTTDLFARTDADTHKRGQLQRDRERILKRATYDMTAELKTAVARRATALGIPASQLAMFLLCDALERLDAGEIDPEPYLEPSESPRFRHNLAYGEWYWFSEI